MKLPDTVRIDAGQGGLRRVAVNTPLAEAEIYLHGAHVTQFQPRGQKPVLFMSSKSSLEAGKPIRGGVPISFPWFGARQDGRPGPMHGFARLVNWELTGAEDSDNGTVAVSFRLVSSPSTLAEWEGEFEVNYTVSVGESLGLDLRAKRLPPAVTHRRSAAQLFGGKRRATGTDRRFGGNNLLGSRRDTPHGNRRRGTDSDYS